MYELGELEVILGPDGRAFPLGDGAARAVLFIGGRGAPPLTYHTVRGYRQASETVVTWTLGPRTLGVTITWTVASRSEYWRARATLMAALRPNQGGPLRLRHIRPDGTQREIEAYPDSAPVFEDESGWETLEERLTFICYDPTFYDPQPRAATFNAVVQEQLVFPIAFPITFGDPERLGDQVAVTYEGDWPAWPLIEATGPYDWLRVVNRSTGAVVKLGQPLGAGETRHLDLTPGRQTLTDGEGVNRFDELVLPDSDLVAFNLRPAGQPWGDSPYEGVPEGVNLLRVEAAGQVVGQTSVTISYQPRYLSVA